MRRLILVALGLLALVPLIESGRILRAWRRRSGRMAPYPPQIRRNHYPSPWNYYRVPRTIHQQGFIESRRNREEIQHFRGFQTERGYQPPHGYPIQRDPTTHYAPPAEDELHLGSGPNRRSNGGHVRRFRPWRRAPPPVTHISLWKLLAMNTRRRYGPPPPRRPFPPFPPPQRPGPPHLQQTSEEAEVAPILPNFVYFLPKDTMTPREANVTERPGSNTITADGLKPGFVSDVPLYPTQASSPSEFRPVTSKDYLMKVVEIRRPGPTLLQPASTTVGSDQHNAPAPDNSIMDPTESLLQELLQEPPSPINSFNINIDPNAEGSESFIKIAPSSFVNTEPIVLPTSVIPSITTSKPISSTTTSTTIRPTSSSTFKPMFAVRVIMPPPNPTTKVIKTTKETNSEKISLSTYSSKEMKKGSITNSKESTQSDTMTSKELKSVIPKAELNSNFNSKEVQSGGKSISSKEIKESAIENSVSSRTDIFKSVIVSGKEEADSGAGEVEIKEETTKAPAKPAPAYKWPTMKPYIKNNKKPVVSTSAKGSSTVVKTSSTTSSSESTSISITGIRSKVKEYKPVLGTAPGLLLFDKVDTSAEVAQKGAVTSSTSSPLKETTSDPSALSTSSSTTFISTVSPMQNFDPMKMIHSWLTKAKPKS